MRQVIAVRLRLLAGMLLMSSAVPAAVSATPLLTGDWGGFQVRVILGEAGGRIELDCASASIDTPIRPDATGKFSAVGRLEVFTPGPDRRGDTAPVLHAASFTGQVEGQTLHLTMQASALGTLQKFKLKRDLQVKIIRCV